MLSNPIDNVVSEAVFVDKYKIISVKYLSICGETEYTGDPTDTHQHRSSLSNWCLWPPSMKDGYQHREGRLQ